MPINTVKCPHCGARVNHIVKAGEAANSGFEQVLACPRCKGRFAVNASSLSARTAEDVRELVDFERRMSESESEFVKAFGNDDGDSVEEALSKADQVFDAAKRALDDISLEETAEVIDADQLLGRYSVPDVKQAAMSRAEQAARRAQQRYDLPDGVVDQATRYADRAYDAASSKVAGKVEARFGDEAAQKLRSLLG